MLSSTKQVRVINTAIQDPTGIKYPPANRPDRIQFGKSLDIRLPEMLGLRNDLGIPDILGKLDILGKPKYWVCPDVPGYFRHKTSYSFGSLPSTSKKENT